MRIARLGAALHNYALNPTTTASTGGPDMSRIERRLEKKRSTKQTGSAAPAEALARLQRHAMGLYQAGRLGPALEACRAILARDSARPDVLGFAGMIAYQLDRPGEAVEFYDRALALKPEFVEAAYNRANALHALGRLEDAAGAYRRVLALNPRLAPAWHNLGGALRALGRKEEAVEPYQRARTLHPAPETERDLGLILQELGRRSEAVDAFRRALVERPDWSDLYSNLAHALMEEGDSRAVVTLCEAWLHHVPGSVEARALEAIALNETGDATAARFLYDFDRLVQRFDLDAPPGYPSLEAFNAALARHVESHPTLRVPAQDHATYHHPALEITEELLIEPKGPMAELERLVRRAVDRYLAAVPTEPAHPFLARFPKRWELHSWATRLAGQGNLIPHIHLDGYLGGVYYPLLPAVVDQPGQGEAGWFELGRPPAELRCAAPPLLRRIQPKPGRLLLFPGYFFHGTVPFQSSERRLSIAFDLVPLDGGR